MVKPNSHYFDFRICLLKYAVPFQFHTRPAHNLWKRSSHSVSHRLLCSESEEDAVTVLFVVHQTKRGHVFPSLESLQPVVVSACGTVVSAAVVQPRRKGRSLWAHGTVDEGRRCSWRQSGDRLACGARGVLMRLVCGFCLLVVIDCVWSNN